MVARRRAGITREALAVAAGLSWAAIAQIETGRRPNPRAETVAALARALDVTTDYLLGLGTPALPLLKHFSLLYDDVAGFVDSTTSFLAEGVEGGEAVLVVTTTDKIKALRKRLGGLADGVTFAPSPAWYASPRAAKEQYQTWADDALAAGSPWLRVIGEPVWTNRTDVEVETWIRYEAMLNLLLAPYPLTLFCPYDRARLPERVITGAIATHCASVATEGPIAEAAHEDLLTNCFR